MVGAGTLQNSTSRCPAFLVWFKCLSSFEKLAELSITHQLSFHVITSGVVRAFPGGRVTHPEGQNEKENEHSLRKNEQSLRKTEESGTLAHLGL